MLCAAMSIALIAACNTTRPEPAEPPPLQVIARPQPVAELLTVPAMHLSPGPVLLQFEAETYLPNPTFCSVEDNLYVSPMSGDSAGAVYRFDLFGNPLGAYTRLGLGPGELGPPNRVYATPDRVYLCERGQAVIHVLDRDLNYIKKERYTASSRIVFADQTYTGRWRYRRLDQERGGGNMLAIHDTASGDELAVLLPFDKMRYAVGMHGSAVHHHGTIYAVSANTVSLDMIDTATWRTLRMPLLDGFRIEEPEDWATWSKSNNKTGTVEGIEAWLETFARPLGITVVRDHLVILYARGKNHFFDIHKPDGTLVSKGNPVSMAFPVINHTRIESVYDVGGNQQFFASIDLEIALTEIGL
jgi:hypothetical protein